MIVELLDYILNLDSQDRPTILSASWGGLESKWNDYKDQIDGNNNLDNDTGPYPASPGWDRCTGWGGADGEKLLAALQALQQASSG